MGATVQAQSKPQPQKESDKGAEIKALLKERHALLEKALAVLRVQYDSGIVDFSKVGQAELDLLKATLDVVDGPDKRIAALQDHQKIAAAIVKVTEAKAKVGLRGEVDVLQAKAILLAVRIELLREEQKAEARK